MLRFIIQIPVGYDSFEILTWIVLYGKRRNLLIHSGNVEKSRQRRSLPSPKRFAQAGRHFAVLTYSMYAPRVKMAAALLDGLF
jgi:hypothetical protein